MVKKILAAAGVVSILGFALPALADTPPTPAQVACVGSAVNTRETALGTAISALTSSVNSAYTARAAALKQAYALTTGNSAIKKAVSGAWSVFSKTLKTARRAWKDSRNAAWTQYGQAVQACKASNVPAEAGKSSLEATGL